MKIFKLFYLARLLLLEVVSWEIHDEEASRVTRVRFFFWQDISSRLEIVEAKKWEYEGFMSQYDRIKSNHDSEVKYFSRSTSTYLVFMPNPAHFRLAGCWKAWKLEGGLASTGLEIGSGFGRE